MTQIARFVFLALLVALLPRPALAESEKPLFKDFMAINGHFTFKPEVYKEVCRRVRNYHNLNWDVKQPGDAITVPVCVNRVNWKDHVYGRWQKEGFETDICLQFSGFQASNANYKQIWTGREQWCFDYGKAVASYFGPSGKEKLCTSIEIGNEPGAKFDPALYSMIFKQMARGIRAGDAKIKILTAAAHARKGDDYIQDLRGIYADQEILPLYDVINLHTYAAIEREKPSQSPWNRSYPEDPAIAYLKVIDETIEWRNKTAPGKEIWITEFGYDACTPEAMKNRKDWALRLDWQGTTDLQQAQYIVRSFFVFAERDVRRAYIYFFDDNDTPGVHGSSGLTRKFIPKPSFFAVRQLYQTLGDYRFKRIVRKQPGELYVYEFQHGSDPANVVWVAWSPTGARTHEKAGHTPRTATVTLSDLPGPVEQALGMSAADGPAPRVEWKPAGPASITLSVGESPVYVIMRRAGR